jgi:hypothetical protein
MEDGTVYQTNWYKTISYHVGDPNFETIGICLNGNFMIDPPTQPQLDAARYVVNLVRNNGGITIERIHGHGQYPGGTASACPGATWPQWFDYLLEPLDERVKLFSVSHWKGQQPVQIFINEGAGGLIAKATEGVDFTDPCYEWYRDECAASYLPFGTWHYFRTAHDPYRQAEHYYDVAYGHELRPAIDVEKRDNEGIHSKDEFTTRLKATLDETELLWGMKPKIYTSLNMWT